jgi:hypothetical protein
VPLRVAPVLIAILVVALLAGCGGGSGEQTATVGNGTITVPSDVHGVYGELEAILDQLPYEAWYTKCVVAQVKKNLSSAEAEALAGLPEDESEEKATLVISRAGPTCEARHHLLPVVDPNSSSKELDLLRAGTVDSMKALAESHGADAEQVACVEEGFEELPDRKVIAVVDGSKEAREGILLSVLKPCASGK